VLILQVINALCRRGSGHMRLITYLYTLALLFVVDVYKFYFNVSNHYKIVFCVAFVVFVIKRDEMKIHYITLSYIYITLSSDLQ